MYNFIPKDQIERTIGKGSFWFPKVLHGGLKYVAGVPEFDAIQAIKPPLTPNPLLIKLLPQGLKIELIHGLKSETVGVSLADIKAVELEVADDIVTHQERSVLGRAAIGGLLLGPLGAIVGGMSGLQAGTKVEKPDMILTIAVERDGEQAFIIGSVKKNDRTVVEHYLKKHLAGFLTISSK